MKPLAVFILPDLAIGWVAVPYLKDHGLRKEMWLGGNDPHFRFTTRPDEDPRVFIRWGAYTFWTDGHGGPPFVWANNVGLKILFRTEVTVTDAFGGGVKSGTQPAIQSRTIIPARCRRVDDGAFKSPSPMLSKYEIIFEGAHEETRIEMLKGFSDNRFTAGLSLDGPCENLEGK